MITLHHLVPWVCLTFFTVLKACPFNGPTQGDKKASRTGGGGNDFCSDERAWFGSGFEELHH